MTIMCQSLNQMISFFSKVCVNSQSKNVWLCDAQIEILYRLQLAVQITAYTTSLMLFIPRNWLKFEEFLTMSSDN